jgi:hypothetical protein
VYGGLAAVAIGALAAGAYLTRSDSATVLDQSADAVRSLRVEQTVCSWAADGATGDGLIGVTIPVPPAGVDATIVLAASDGAAAADVAAVNAIAYDAKGAALATFAMSVIPDGGVALPAAWTIGDGIVQVTGSTDRYTFPGDAASIGLTASAGGAAGATLRVVVTYSAAPDLDQGRWLSLASQLKQGVTVTHRCLVDNPCPDGGADDAELEVGGFDGPGTGVVAQLDDQRVHAELFGHGDGGDCG